MVAVMAVAGQGAGSVLVTGGGGALGPPVLRAFTEAGWSVRSLSRSEAIPLGAGRAVDHVQGDIRDEPLVRQAMQGVDVVVHMASLLHVTDGANERAAEYRDVNVHGTEVVVGAAGDAGVARIVFTSSICVYGSFRKGLLDEESDLDPDTPYAETKREAEQVVLKGKGEVSVPEGVVLRLAAVYGPGIKGNYFRLARAVSRGRFIAVGGGANRRTLVFEEDAARAIVIAATHPKATGRVYNVTDGDYHTVAEITKAIADAFGRPTPRWAVPLSLARVVVAALESGSSALGRKPPMSRATLEKYTEEIVVSGRRMRSELGFEARCDLAEGWRRTASGMRAEGRL